jgi:hypothetical protein
VLDGKVLSITSALTVESSTRLSHDVFVHHTLFASRGTAHSKPGPRRSPANTVSPAALPTGLLGLRGFYHDPLGEPEKA